MRELMACEAVVFCVSAALMAAAIRLQERHRAAGERRAVMRATARMRAKLRRL